LQEMCQPQLIEKCHEKQCLVMSMQKNQAHENWQFTKFRKPDLRNITREESGRSRDQKEQRAG